jgi:hypothetical protein
MLGMSRERLTPSMPITYRIDRAAHRVVLALSGAMVNQEIDACYGRLFLDPDYIAGLDLLVDLRASDDMPSAIDIRERARRAGALKGRFSGRVAQVFATNGVQYGMGRMYSVFAQEFGIISDAFTSLEEADQWLKDARATPPGS